MSLDELRALEQAAKLIARERERRHWTIAQWRELAGDSWTQACAYTQTAADEAVDALLGRVAAAEAERDALRAVRETARAFVATTTVFRQRRDCRPEFEALCIALLDYSAVLAASASGVDEEDA